jgi:hypothetical protein
MNDSRAAYCLLPAAYCLLPAAYCLLPTAYCLLPAAYCLLPAAYCLLPTACCLLPTVHRLPITPEGPRPPAAALHISTYHRRRPLQRWRHGKASAGVWITTEVTEVHRGNRAFDSDLAVSLHLVSGGSPCPPGRGQEGAENPRAGRADVSESHAVRRVHLVQCFVHSRLPNSEFRPAKLAAAARRVGTRLQEGPRTGRRKRQTLRRDPAWRPAIGRRRRRSVRPLPRAPGVPR